MHKFFIHFILIASLQPAFSQSIFSSLRINKDDYFDSSTRPMQIIETTTWLGAKAPVTTKSSKNFSRTGKLVWEERFDKNNQLEATLYFKYDTSEKLLVESTIERYAKYADRLIKTVYSYDNDHFLTGITNISAAGEVYRVSRQTNNEKGHPVKIEIFNKDSSLFATETAEYFYERNMAITSVYKYDGTLFSKDSMPVVPLNKQPREGAKADEKGNLVFYRQKKPDGSWLIQEMEYLYDERGNWIERKRYTVQEKSNGKRKRKLDYLEKRVIIYY